MSVTIDQMMSAVRRVIEQELDLERAKVATHRAFLDQYLSALEADRANRFALENGFEGPRPPEAPRILEKLLESLATFGRTKTEVPLLDAAPPEEVEIVQPSEPVGDSSNYPLLLAATVSGQALVILGGDPRPEKLEKIRLETGLATQWLSSRDWPKLVKRIRQGTVCGVIVLPGLLGHGAIDAVRAATRRGVPQAQAGTGGCASLLEALRQLENALARCRS